MKYEHYLPYLAIGLETTKIIMLATIIVMLYLLNRKADRLEKIAEQMVSK